MNAKLSKPVKPAIDPLEGLDESTLYWHIFCHCVNREISFCGGSLAKPTGKTGGYGDGGNGITAIDDWDGLGEFCPICVAQVGDLCPWGCSCGECRALEPRSKWWKLWEKRKSPF